MKKLKILIPIFSVCFGLFCGSFSFYIAYTQISLFINGIPSVAEITYVKPQTCRKVRHRIRGFYSIYNRVPCMDVSYSYTLRGQVKTVDFIYQKSNHTKQEVVFVPFKMDDTLKVGNRYNVLVDPDNDYKAGPDNYDPLILSGWMFLLSSFFLFGGFIMLKARFFPTRSARSLE